jgi:pilus assembly protein CpaF
MLWGDETRHIEATAVAADYPQVAPIDDALGLKVRLHQRLIDLLNLSMLDRTPRDALRQDIRGAVIGLLMEEKRLLTPSQTDQLVEEILDELLGLGRWNRCSRTRASPTS